MWKKSSRSNGNGGNNCVEVDANWHKSTRSNPSGNCVEVSDSIDEVRVRDTKAKGNGPILTFTRDEWIAFVEGVKLGEFDI
jgi:hypothetical protein